MELEVFARIVQRWWLGIVLALVVGSMVGFAFAESRTPVYQTGVDLLVGPLSASSDVLRAAGQTAQTYAELASASSTLDVVAEERLQPRAVEAEVTATASEVTRILKVRVRADDAVLANDVANGIADELVRVSTVEVEDALASVDAGDDTIARVGAVRVLEPATVPSTPIAPNKQLIVALGGLSMMVAVAVALIGYEYARQTVRVVGDVDRFAPGVTVGRIERSLDVDDPDAVEVLSDPGDSAAVSLRGLSIDVTAQLATSDAVGLAVGGIVDGDRSGDVAVNLAAALSTTGRRVAIIDANEATHEVREWLLTKVEPPSEPLSIPVGPAADILWEGRFPGVEAGVLDLYSTELTRLPERDDMEAALARLGDGYDHVVMHIAPVFGSAAAARWTAAAAGSLLVVTADVASARTAERCVATLSRSARTFVGVAFDERRARRRTSLLRRLFGGGRSRPERLHRPTPPVDADVSDRTPELSGRS